MRQLPFSELQERLVGFILLNLLVTEEDTGEFLLSAMIEAKILDEIEGKELQALYEKIWGKKKVRLHHLPSGAKRIEFETVKMPDEVGRDDSRLEFFVKALEHLKKGKMLYLPADEPGSVEEIFEKS